MKQPKRFAIYSQRPTHATATATKIARQPDKPRRRGPLETYASANPDGNSSRQAETRIPEARGLPLGKQGIVLRVPQAFFRKLGPGFGDGGFR